MLNPFASPAPPGEPHFFLTLDFPVCLGVPLCLRLSSTPWGDRTFLEPRWARRGGGGLVHQSGDWGTYPTETWSPSQVSPISDTPTTSWWVVGFPTCAKIFHGQNSPIFFCLLSSHTHNSRCFRSPVLGAVWGSHRLSPTPTIEIRLPRLSSPESFSPPGPLTLWPFSVARSFFCGLSASGFKRCDRSSPISPRCCVPFELWGYSWVC